MKLPIKISRYPYVTLVPLALIIIGFLAIQPPTRVSITKQNTSPQSDISKQYEMYRVETLVDVTYAQMTHKERIGQLFMLSIPGTTINPQIEDLITNYHIGGVVLMGHNVANQAQLEKFTTDLQKLADIDLLIATDQEGGVVARIWWDEARYISQPHIGTVGRKDFAYETGKQHAEALQSANIDVNLAPVLDSALLPGSVMSSRSLSSNPEEVADLGIELIRAHQDVGILPTAKHFPGIGRSMTDSHLAVPVIDVSKEVLIANELQPFITAINNNVPIIMTGHALYPQIDPDKPSSISPIIITEILRNELGFEGLILTDDMRMGALNNYPDKYTEALHAGNDMLLLVDTPQNQSMVIDELGNNNSLNEEIIEQHVKNILRLKYRYLD